MVKEASACHPTQRPTGTPPASQEEGGRGAGSQAGKAGEEASESSARWNPWAGLHALSAAHPASDPPATAALPAARGWTGASHPPAPRSPESRLVRPPQPPKPSGVGMLLLGAQSANKGSGRPWLRSQASGFCQGIGAQLVFATGLHRSQESMAPPPREQPRDRGQGGVLWLIIRQEEA